MPVTYEIDEKRGILRITARGATSPQEQAELAGRWSRDPAYRPGMAILLDNRERSQPSSSEQVRAMVEHATDATYLTPGTRCAIVVASDVEFGMARSFASLSGEGPMNTSVFREIADAEYWLASDPG